MIGKARLGLVALLLLGTASWAAAAPAQLETRVDASEISLGQSLTLQLRLRGALMDSEPDLAPLEQSFEVVDVARSQRQSWVNGAHDASSDWTITLLPKSSGTLEIPALRVGSELSAPQQVRVLAAAQGAPPARAEASPGPAGAPAVVRVVVERPDPYEQERVLLKVRLFAGPELVEGTLADPVIDGAIVERLGEDRDIRGQIAGREYRGIERTYAVLPDAPGRLVVAPIAFEGLARAPRPAPARRRSGFFGRSLIDDFFSGSGFADDFFEPFFDRGTRRVVVQSEPLTLDVRPRPAANGNAWWLPARSVSLTESWNPAPGEVRVGQALTRRITLRAQGAGASQLPALVPAEIDGVKMYAEAPRNSESEAGSERVQEITVIPTRPGRLELPPIEVAWWDVGSDTPRVASLDARSFEVLPAVGVGTSPPQPGAAPANAPSASEKASPAGAPAPVREAPALDALPAPLWGAAALLLAGLTALAGWWLRGRRERVPSVSRRAAERSLRRACRRCDPAAAEHALRQILRIRQPDRARPDALQWARESGSEAFAREVARLQSVRYSSGQQGWQGKQLWAAYRSIGSIRKRREPSGQGSRGGLPPLYPAQAGREGAHEAS